MVQLLGRRSTHAGRLEYWLGAEAVERISASMKDWYGPPIAVKDVPGAVFARGGGDFVGPIEGGGAATLGCFMKQHASRAFRRWFERQTRTTNVGFASLSDLISEATAGKRREFQLNKTGQTGVVGATNSLWFVGPQPAAGAAAAAAPGGTVPTSSTTGAFAFTNPTGGDTQHFVNAYISANFANTLLLYDRLFSVTKTMNSTATEAVTGTPTRYQNTSAGDDFAGGNFLMVECRTALAATAHNWTVCTYTDQGGAASTLPSLTGNSGNIVGRLDHPLQQWFAPLESGDTGIRTLTQMQCSAAVATGAIDFTIGHPIAIIPVPIAQLIIPFDGLNSAFNLARIFDNACLAFLEINKPATNATTYNGTFLTVAG